MLAQEMVAAVVPTGDVVFVEAAWDALLLSLIKVHTWHYCATHTAALRLAKSDGTLAEAARCRTVA